MYRFLLIDDHPLTRSGIRMLLKSRFPAAVVEEASDEDEALTIAKGRSFDLVLMDISMPNTDSQRLLEMLKIYVSKAKIIIFSMNKESVFSRIYMKKGADGYIEKSVSDIDFLKAIDRILRGELCFGKSSTDKGSETLQTGDSPYSVLTDKEMEVLMHLVGTGRMKEISQALTIASSTLSTHKAKIFSKLKVDSMMELRELVALFPLLH